MPTLSLFARLFVWFSARHVWRNRGRAAAVLVGIALGAAVFTSVRLAVHASLAAFTQSMDLIAGRADWRVEAPGERLPETLVAELGRHPAVAAAAPMMQTLAHLPGEAAVPFILIGIDPILDRPFRDWDRRGSPPEGGSPWLTLIKEPFTFVCGEALSREHRWAEGDAVILETRGRLITLKHVASLTPAGLALVEGGRIAIVDIATFQEITGIMGQIDRIDLRMRDASDPEAVEAVRRALPPGAFLAPPVENRESGLRMMRAYQINLSILSFAALFVGMFLVYSLVALNAAARRHELAVMRSLGASPRMIFFIFLAEGALFGVLGWLLAVPISSLCVEYLLRGVSQTISTLFVRVQVEHLTISAWEILLSWFGTVAIATLAAFHPAHEAMRIAPNEVLQAVAEDRRSSRSLAQLARNGLILLLLVWPLAHLPGPPGFPLPGYLATFLLFIGFALFAPWLLKQFGSGLPPLLRRLAGEPAYLASRYVQASTARTAISAGALITAVALFTALVIMVHSFRHTVELWVEQTVNGDVFLYAKTADGNAFEALLTPETRKVLETLPADIDLVPYRRVDLKYDGVVYHFEALDLNTFTRYGDFIWLEGTAERVLPQLAAGQGVVVSEVFANRTGVGVGARFEAQVGTTTVAAPVLGIVRDYRTQGGAVFYSLEHFNARARNPGWSGARIFFKQRDQDLASAGTRLIGDLRKRCGPTVAVVMGSTLRQTILRIFDETFAVTTVLLLIALIVAALGVTTTLTVLVLERTRQLNTLLAIGAARSQVRSMIFWEATLMVLAGESAGLLCGFCLSYLLIYVINLQSFGWTFLYRIDWGSLGLSLPLIVATALLAALPAVKVAFRKSPATLLRE